MTRRNRGFRAFLMMTTAWKGAPECRINLLYAFPTRPQPPSLPPGFKAVERNGSWHVMKDDSATASALHG